MKNKNLSSLSQEKLCELIDIYAKNWLAMDGLWFQSVEKKFGMPEAMFHDEEVWRNFTVIEAKRIKTFLNLPPRSGIEGLKKALGFRLYANLAEDECIILENALIYRVIKCRVQSARGKKSMEFHPCKPVGLVEYAGFAKEIDDRFTCECISCYPEVTDESCACIWKFTLNE